MSVERSTCSSQCAADTILAGLPLGLEKMGRRFPVREMSTKFRTDWKSQGKSHKIPENLGNFR